MPLGQNRIGHNFILEKFWYYRQKKSCHFSWWNNVVPLTPQYDASAWPKHSLAKMTGRGYSLAAIVLKGRKAGTIKLRTKKNERVWRATEPTYFQS